jgi:hypothetical protein
VRHKGIAPCIYALYLMLGIKMCPECLIVPCEVGAATAAIALDLLKVAKVGSIGLRVSDQTWIIEIANTK